MFSPICVLACRFSQNFFVVNKDFRLVFYVMAPLISSNGHRVGTLCIMGQQPRKFDATRGAILANLSELLVSCCAHYLLGMLLWCACTVSCAVRAGAESGTAPRMPGLVMWLSWCLFTSTMSSANLLTGCRVLLCAGASN